MLTNDQCEFIYLAPTLMEDPRSELASLLATGLLRWHQQRRLLEIRACPDSPRPGLEHVAETALSVVNPVYAPETTTVSEGEWE